MIGKFMISVSQMNGHPTKNRQIGRIADFFWSIGTPGDQNVTVESGFASDLPKIPTFAFENQVR